VCYFPLRLIIAACVRLRIHPNLLTFIGVLINAWAGWALAMGHFKTAGGIMIVANIFDFIDGKVAQETGSPRCSAASGIRSSTGSRTWRCPSASSASTRAWAAWTLVLLTSIAMVFATMTSYTRARRESLIKKCKVGFMERPERIVLFMIGAFTNRMVNVMWIIAVLSVVTVINRIQLHVSGAERPPQPRRGRRRPIIRARVLLDRRADDAPYDLWVITILAFTWLVPPDWLGDPMAQGSRPRCSGSSGSSNQREAQF
jgi:CDP-diacylglycerol--glycerol-3-phosphate 3-phosphatidyltransferase